MYRNLARSFVNECTRYELELFEFCYIFVWVATFMLRIHVYHTNVSVSLTVNNVLGQSVLTNIRSNELRLIYTDSDEKLTEWGHEIIVSNYRADFFEYEETYAWVNAEYHGTLPALSLVLKQNFYMVIFKLINTTFIALNYDRILFITISSHTNNIIIIENCIFHSNYQYAYTQKSIITIEQLACKSKLVWSCSININYCSFIKNEYKVGILVIGWIVEECLTNEGNKTLPWPMGEYSINHCTFDDNSARILIGLHSAIATDIVLHINETQFLNFKDYECEPPWPTTAITATNIKLYFYNAVIFNEVFVKYGLLHTNDEIFVSNNLTLSNIRGSCVINGSTNHKIILIKDACVNISNVTVVQKLFILKNNPVLFYPPCYFQYQKTRNGNKTMLQKIMIYSKSINKIFDSNTANINCRFQQNTNTYESNPLKLYLQHIEIEHKDRIFNTGFLCYCQGRKPNCYTNALGSIYPGQKVTLQLSLNPEIIKDNLISVATKNSVVHESVCRVDSLLETEQYVERKCTALSYTIFSDGNTYCKLFLYSGTHLTIYFITLLSCPMGFSLSIDTLDKRCTCDPVLVVNKITRSCNINDQTILRPAGSWMSAKIHNNSYTYHTSLQCPFHYCLPYSSHLNLSTPNSQCQFNRSGVLCGHCQQGLSTIFSSSHCKSCSNIYLLLIIPIIVIGFVLVMLLFLLNLTATDGTVNGFIVYANIISINTPVLFPNINDFTPTYTFISLANLDLGIGICFYNGMDDYAKMWLQLAFPFYLIFIATLIIITSRYSTKIQRLTARRALPVLATLFLLSYTKILRIVSSVLFSYSTVTHLPSKHTTLVWSVDANVPLFGVRFTILFTVCLILFLILVPFNVILLFTRTLSRFRFINKFKPLLDAYQGPYKIKFYYWTGLQLLIRVVFFGLSSLDRNLNITISIALFSLIEGIQGALKPFKGAIKNFQEQLFLINLTVLYAFLLYNQETNKMAVNIMIAIAAVHFIIIIVYHIVTYMCSAVIKSKVKSSINVIIQKMNVLQRRSFINQFELEDNIRSNIPEVVNYHEFREPLLNQY